MACWALWAAAEHSCHSAESLEHSLSAGLKGWSVNGPKTSKGRLERARYPIHLNAKPGGHRLSILEPRAAKGCKPHARHREAARSCPEQAADASYQEDDQSPRTE